RTRAPFAQPSMQRLADLGELGLLEELERRGLAHEIGDDAAQLDGFVITQDALVEGVHFRLDWISWRDLGFRAAAVNLSDLAAVPSCARRCGWRRDGGLRRTRTRCSTFRTASTPTQGTSRGARGAAL